MTEETSLLTSLLSNCDDHIPIQIKRCLGQLTFVNKQKKDLQAAATKLTREYSHLQEKKKTGKRMTKIVEEIKKNYEDVQVMCVRKVALARKIYGFAEVNLNHIISQVKERKRDKKSSVKQDKKAKAEKHSDKLQDTVYVEPVTFEMNAELLRAFGPINAPGTKTQSQSPGHKASRAKMSPPSSPLQQRRSRAGSLVPLNLEKQTSAEPLYCFCNNVSYGDMIGCDNEKCPYEWFHFPCVGLSQKPIGGASWICQFCTSNSTSADSQNNEIQKITKAPKSQERAAHKKVHRRKKRQQV